MTDRNAFIILNMLPGIGPVRVQELLTRFDSPSKLLELSQKELSSVPGIGEKLAGTLASWKESVKYEEEISLAEKAGVQIVTKTDPEYPALLKEIYDPPLVLYVRGKLPEANTHLLGVVGSRRVTNYGRKMADHLVSSASLANWTIVSGLAYGIDAAAHSATLNAGGKTIAVLGSGLAKLHPQHHISMAKEIIEKGGAVISEFPMHFAPNKRSFPQRNRIISGISHGVLVIEAGFKSGSLITAKFALEQGRLVFAVPGQADNPQARGTNNLIRDGAVITETFDDIINEFEFLPGISPSAVPQQNELSSSVVIPDNLTENEKTIFALIEKERELSADQISNSTGIATGQLLATLMQLEMKKLITQLPGKRFAVK